MAQVYQSSRLTSGNLIFPDTISVEPGGLHYVKRRMLGSNEEVINYQQIASVRVINGVIFATMVIETTGGSAPITVRGLSRKDAREIRESIQAMQARGVTGK